MISLTVHSLIIMSSSSSFKFIQKLSKKRETGPQVARANVDRPNLQLFEDKINIITVITIKHRTNRI